MLKHINTRFTTIMASIFIVFAVSSVQAQLLIEQEEQQRAGDIVPDVSFTNSDGQQVKISDYRGKVVLLNFWATWCAPCIKEMPDLDDLQAELGEDRFKVIALSEDSQAPKVEEFYKTHNIKHLELFHDKGSRVFFEMGLRGLPYSIIIDQNGKEISRIEGFIDWKSGTRLIIDSLLK